MTKPPASRSAAPFPRPDRSDQTPRLTRTAENAGLDIGWNEGVLRDGRPWRLEAWVEDGVTMFTYFFARRGIRARSDAGFATLLEREELLRFTGEQRFVQALPLIDVAGHELWSVNVVAGDEDGNFVDETVRLRRYPSAPAVAELPAASGEVNSEPLVEWNGGEFVAVGAEPREARYTQMDPAEAWPSLLDALTGVLHELGDGEALILIVDSTNHFVQFSRQHDGGFRAEAKSNHYIEEEELLLTPDAQRRLLDLGWTAPTFVPVAGEREPDEGSPNYWLDVLPPVRHDTLAGLALATLRQIYGVWHPGELSYDAVNFAGESRRFPALGVDWRTDA